MFLIILQGFIRDIEKKTMKKIKKLEFYLLIFWSIRSSITSLRSRYSAFLYRNRNSCRNGSWP